MRLKASVLRSGLFAAWLALSAILASPVGMGMGTPLPAPNFSPSALLDAAPICGQHGTDPASDDHHGMVDCALCLCCAPLIAMLPAPIAPPLPAPIVIAVAAPMQQPRAPPGTVRHAAYPRGPPASI